MTSILREHQGKLLLLFVLLGFFLRFHHIDKFGLAGDEKYSLFVSQFTSYQGNNQKDSVRKPDSPYFTAKEFWSKKGISGFYDAIARVDTGNGAFFTYLLHFWTLWFGVSDTSLRMIPLIFSLLMVPLIYVFAKKHVKVEGVAIISAGLAAISPFYISYAQVARNYALLFFFALLSTHFFLEFLKSQGGWKKWYFVILYGVTAAICEMNHLSTFPLFFIHFAFLLVYYRSWSHFLGFCVAMAFPLTAIVLWLLSPGGAYLFDYVGNSVKVYTEMATTSPYEFLSLTSFKSVALQIRHVFSAMIISIDGFYDGVPSKKAGLAGLILLLAGTVLFSKERVSWKWKWIGITLLSLVGVAITGFRSWFMPVFLINTALTGYAWFSMRELADQEKRKIYVFLALLSLVPVFFLVLFAVQDGNTFRIITRYAGYGYAFAIIWVVWAYAWLLENKPDWKPLIAVAVALQIVQISSLVNKVYEDRQPRYFMDYAEPRTQNPYPIIAAKIEEMAAPGDTVIYPSDQYVKTEDEAYYSVIDAQMTNFYLPKDNVVYQRVDPNERNKVILKSPDGSETELFDFKGSKYRY